MRKRVNLTWLVLALLAASAAAQTVTGSGTTNTVPVFTGSSTIGNSSSPIVVNPSNGNVGIGTITAPQATLDIESSAPGNVDLLLGTGGNPYLQFLNNATSGYANLLTQGGDQLILFGSGAENQGALVIGPWSSGSNGMRIQANGNVGVGTANPAAPLSVVTTGSNTPGVQTTVLSIGTIDSSATGGRFVFHQALDEAAITGWDSGGWGGHLSFFTAPSTGSSPGGTLTERMRILDNGDVGIGTTSPGQPLEVNGNAQVDGTLTGSSGGSVSVGSGGILFPGSGTAQTIPWTGVLCGGDYAEAVDVANDRKQYEPGDVLVVASDKDGDVEKSAEPYSTMVSGIFATKPGAIGRRQTMPASADEIPMAMVGIVPTKVSAENGPIRRGDLLVTSSLKGYAMKGTDRSRMLGAVIGKAMGSLDSGTGVIEVLVTLQ